MSSLCSVSLSVWLLKNKLLANVLKWEGMETALDMDEAQGLTTRPILYILKHIWKLDEQKVKELFTIGRDLDEQDRKLLIDTAVDYVRRYDPHFTWDIIEEIATQTVGKGEAMTPALRSSLEEEREKGLLQGKQEGRMEGIQKGRMEGKMAEKQAVIAKMLKKNLQISVISEVTGLSKAQIKKLQNGTRRNSK